MAAPRPADTRVTPPAADVPTDMARWPGRFSGWACRAKDCATKLAADTVTAGGTGISYGFASASVTPNATRASAQFVGDELHSTLPNGATVNSRMLASGEVEFLYQTNQTSAGGILVREP